MNVLLYDSRNHGKSDGDTFSSLPRFAEDLGSVIAWTKQRDPSQKIVVLGHSIGAAAAMLAASAKGTVPVLITGTQVIDESYEIMLWALGKNDPESWLDVPPEAHKLIAETDGPFKTSLDRYKYASRIADADPIKDRNDASLFLQKLNTMLNRQPFLLGNAPRLPDMAIASFVRQFAHVDLDWFTRQPWPDLADWLSNFKSSERFINVMEKHPLWVPETTQKPV